MKVPDLQCGMFNHKSTGCRRLLEREYANDCHLAGEQRNTNPAARNIVSGLKFKVERWILRKHPEEILSARLERWEIDIDTLVFVDHEAEYEIQQRKGSTDRGNDRKSEANQDDADHAWKNGRVATLLRCCVDRLIKWYARSCRITKTLLLHCLFLRNILLIWVIIWHDLINVYAICRDQMKPHELIHPHQPSAAKYSRLVTLNKKKPRCLSGIIISDDNCSICIGREATNSKKSLYWFQTHKDDTILSI